MRRTTDEQRARHAAYMRRYKQENWERIRPARLEASHRYWEKHKEKIMARRRARRTDAHRERDAINAKRRYAEKPEVRAYQASWARKNRDRIKAAARKRGVRRREIEAGRLKPSLCEVCGESGKINFDHCHQRGIFRGWLCSNCNKALGFAKDDPNRLRQLIAYLERTKNYVSPQLELPV